ncbi:uncharacterized protein KY384_001565 [Bacidia gigantensis]|uniref:uncharacterized protein n=1 Tax=Bacidia gigantensis TaxID=2732470 RepID=UPI001D0530CD|nr:uncharacterized protein KY384_001565 [Bacidia gigantensis]KAG8533824.1 hypothetical protein KY384_001565 [Bacidia gigantensis]
MVVNRSMLLTVKKTSRTVKTLEGSLLMNKDGERTSMSSRVAELDLLMPENLGVSKAILESVIFCHQDESLWPMSEPSHLKKRFDEIFEALKYTKAIDNIKALRKTQGDKLRLLVKDEQTAKEVKMQGDKAEKNSRDLDDQLKILRKEIGELNEKAQDAREKTKEATDEFYNFKNVVDSLDLGKQKHSFHQSNVNKLKKNLKERNESDEWLRSEIADFEQRAKTRQEHQRQQKEQYGDLEKAIDDYRNKLGRKQSELGRYEQQKSTHEEQLELRKTRVQHLSRQYNVRGYETNLNDTKIAEFLAKMRKLCKERQVAVEKARNETESDVREAQESLNKLNDQKSTLNADHRASKQQISQNDQKLKAYRSELSNMAVDEGEIAILDSKMEELEASLEGVRNESRTASRDLAFQKHDKDIRDLMDKAKQLNDELIESTKQAGNLAELEHVKKEQADRQRNLDRLTNVHKGKLNILLHDGWHHSTLESKFDKVLNDRTQSLINAERQRALASKELEQIDLELSILQKTFEKGKQESAACEKRIRLDVEVEPEQYHAELADIESGRDIIKSDLEGFGHEREYWKKAIERAETRHKCKLCTRPFQRKEEAEFVDFLKEKVGKENEDLTEAKKDLERVEKKLLQAKNAGISYETWNRLAKGEIPKLEDNMKELSSRRNAVIRKLEDHDATVNEHEQASADVDTLAKPVANIARYYEEATNLSSQVQCLERKQRETRLPRTPDEIRDQLDSTNDGLRHLAKAKDKLALEKENARSNISSLELQLRDAKSDIAESNHDLKEKDHKQKQIEELSVLNQTQRDRIRQVDANMQEILPQVEAAQDQLDDKKSRGYQKENNLRTESSELTGSLHTLEKAEDIIRKFAEEGGSGNLARCAREMDSLRQEIRQTEDDQKDVIKSINKITEEMRGHEEVKRIIQDNLEYRDSLRELETLQKEISDLEAQNAEADRDHWQNEANKWQNLFNKYSTEKTGKLGQAKEKDNQLAKLIADWQTDFRDAAFKYKKAHIEVETTKAAIEDLGRYGGALDKAIMKYHSIKMEEINRIIEELWKKTYQGTDVDTILIRSDNESAKGNRSYNYRVCMVKQDAEMDMRGRCSAGQKVLASIIIRLALAECFGVNCGLITLDEPTTNLDRDNIHALARSLHDLIQTRRHQANFQLIIITHDEEFLASMGCSDFCDHYYRVLRNERQKSIIKLQDIHEVM